MSIGATSIMSDVWKKIEEIEKSLDFPNPICEFVEEFLVVEEGEKESVKITDVDKKEIAKALREFKNSELYPKLHHNFNLFLQLIRNLESC